MKEKFPVIFPFSHEIPKFFSIRCFKPETAIFWHRSRSPGATPKGFTLEVIEQLPVWTTPGLRDAPQNWQVWLDVQPNIYDLEL